MFSEIRRVQETEISSPEIAPGSPEELKDWVEAYKKSTSRKEHWETIGIIDRSDYTARADKALLVKKGAEIIGGSLMIEHPPEFIGAFILGEERKGGGGNKTL